MKTSQIARGIVGALSLAGVIGAVGCSADAGYEGAAGEGEIGSSEQALVTAVTPSLPAVRNRSASCLVTVGGVDKIVVAGGVDNSANHYANSILFTPDTVNAATGAFAGAVENFPAGAVAVKDPIFLKLDATHCLLIGGTDSSNAAQVKTYLYTAGAGTPWSDAGSLPAARTDARAVKCGTNKALLIAGDLGSGPVSSIVHWDGGTTWAAFTRGGTSTPVALSSNRVKFGAASNPAGTAILVAGGNTGSGEVTTVQLLKTDATCANNSAATQAPVAAGTALAGAREALAVEFSRQVTVSGVTKDEFVVALGRNGGTSSQLYEVYQTDIAPNPPTATRSANGNTGLAFDSPTSMTINAGHVAFFGGEVSGAITNKVLEYMPGAPATFQTADVLGTSQVRPSAAFAPSAKTVNVAGAGSGVFIFGDDTGNVTTVEMREHN